MTKINPKHYNKFKECLASAESWKVTEKAIESWWKYVCPSTKGHFPKDNMTRQKLKDICADDQYSDEDILGNVMAWGKQNRRHARDFLFPRKDEIKPIIGKMRQGSIDRIEAYEDFYQIWKLKKPLGMGAAYFTKLIFFCDPNHNGYIMDQWTSKSVNLLCGKPIVHLDSSGYVTKKNDSQNYQHFCNIIEDIAKDIAKDTKMSAENVEMDMFSKGGWNKGEWRKYVIDHYKK